MALTWLYFGGIRNLANTKDSPPLRAKELASSSDPQLLKYQASSSSETWSYDAKPDGNDDISATIGRTDSGTSLDERASKPDDSKSTTDWINAGVDLQCLMRRSPNEANRYFRDSMGNDQSIVNPYQYSNIQNLDPHGGWRRDAHQPSAPGLLESYAPCLESLNAPAPWPADSSIRYTNVGFQRV